MCASDLYLCVFVVVMNGLFVGAWFISATLGDVVVVRALCWRYVPFACRFRLFNVVSLFSRCNVIWVFFGRCTCIWCLLNKFNWIWRNFKRNSSISMIICNCASLVIWVGISFLCLRTRILPPYEEAVNNLLSFLAWRASRYKRLK